LCVHADYTGATEDTGFIMEEKTISLPCAVAANIFDPTGSHEAAVAEQSWWTARTRKHCGTTHGQAGTEACLYIARKPMTAGQERILYSGAVISFHLARTSTCTWRLYISIAAKSHRVEYAYVYGLISYYYYNLLTPERGGSIVQFAFMYVCM
jgi:hypothetical protein